MRVFRNLSQLPSFKNSVITIGTFDGVHKGHQKIISRINRIASEIAGESIIITFHPHPRIVIHPEDKSLRLLNTLEEKIELLEKYAVDNLVVVPFSRDFSEQEADEYIRNFLVNSFKPACIVIGYDHKFGKNRSGDYTLLEKMKTQYGYRLEEITKQTLADIDISSTKIRAALNCGNVPLANELSGHPYTLSGMVVKGLQNGRKLGFPTANIQCSDSFKLIPKCGIYAVKVRHQQMVYNGMLSIGYNPTFEGKEQTIEVNILNFDKEIYGETLTLEFVQYLRDEKKFNSVEELIEAIKEDERQTRQLLAT
ncbi:MAG: bifunctional riboflavin kinase/FAD synthetase [Chitinophagales bacterium]|nr:bifunctional riboflavin kinase/FAD synthetase [Chitinophagales bacterium]